MNFTRALLLDFVPPALLKIHLRLRELLCVRLGWTDHSDHNKLHLGCGSNLIPGWTNVDLSDKNGVARHDLTKPLPVGTESVDFIFSEHFIEHITREQAKNLLHECYRVLRVGGVFRISTPDLRKLVNAYREGNLDEWSELGWRPRTPCALMNEGMRLWGHQFIFDAEELRGLMLECGFGQVEQVPWRESSHHELRGLECRPFHDDLIFECTK
jgi:predicted SAM-dependent methyltransferase